VEVMEASHGIPLSIPHSCARFRLIICSYAWMQHTERGVKGWYLPWSPRCDTCEREREREIRLLGFTTLCSYLISYLPGLGRAFLYLSIYLRARVQSVPGRCDCARSRDARRSRCRETRARDDRTPQEVLRLLLQPADRVHHRLLPLRPPLRHERRRRLLRPPAGPGPRPLLLPGASRRRLAPSALPPALPRPLGLTPRRQKRAPQPNPFSTVTRT
jgi:hypothetical protein